MTKEENKIVGMLFVAICSFICVFVLLLTINPLGHKTAGLIALCGALICFITLSKIIDLRSYDNTAHFDSDFACVRAPTIIMAQPAHTKYVSLPTVHVDDEI